MKVLIGLLLLALSACSTGYRSLNQPLSYNDEKVSVTVPPIKGDIDGTLRTALIQELSSNGGFVFTGSRAKYELAVKILSNSKDRIGYKYDQQPITGKMVNRLVANEGRRTVEIEANLIDRSTKKKVQGPFRVSGYAEYDYVNSNSYENMIVNPELGNQQSVLAYSLGQLGSEEEASNTALNPAFRSVAKKTASYLQRLLAK